MARARVVVLVSGSGTNLQALIDAAATDEFPAEIVAVGADRQDIQALARAEDAGIPTFVTKAEDFGERSEWDDALADHVADFAPTLIVLAGFMKLVGAGFRSRFPDMVINTHPALSPAFPGAHAPRDAVTYGVKVSGCTIFLIDEGVDTGPIVAQAAVPVLDGDSEHSLHGRIKVAEHDLLVETVATMVSRPYRIEGRKVVWS